MSTIEKIQNRINAIKAKELDSGKLSKSESLELGRLYIALEVYNEYSSHRLIKRADFDFIGELNDFLIDKKEIVSIQYDFDSYSYLILYKENI